MLRNPTSDPGDHAQDGGRSDDNPAPQIGRFKVESMAGVPDEVTDAVAQMVENRDGPAEQQQQPNPGAEEILDAFIGLRSSGSGDQPPHEQNRPRSKRYPGGAMHD